MGVVTLIPNLPDELYDPAYFLEGVDAKDGVLLMRVRAGDVDNPSSPEWDDLTFQIAFPRPLEVAVPVGEWTEAFIHDEHPLLWPHVGPQATLSFNGAADSPSEVAGELLAAHQDVTGGSWLAIDRFLNQAIGVTELLGGGFGTLAEGPRQLMEAYAEVLAKAGIRPSVHSSREAKHWEDGHWATRDDLKVTVFHSMGPSPDGYIVSSAPSVLN